MNSKSRKQAITLLAECIKLLDLPDVEVPAIDRKWVIQKIYSEMTGYETWRLRDMRKREDLVYGVHYKKDPAGVWVWNVKEMVKWQENEQSQTPDTTESMSPETQLEFESGLLTEPGPTNQCHFKQALEGLRKQRNCANG